MALTKQRDVRELEERRNLPLSTPTDLHAEATRDIAAALNKVLADVFALYVKTKNFHWHTSGRHFRDDHLLLDEQADQLFAMTDPVAERVRKIGGITLHSIGQIARLQRVHQVRPLEGHAAAFGNLLQLLEFSFGQRPGVMK